MIKIGITGGIGCGKSEVCNILQREGIPIIHADKVAQLLINNKEKIKSKIIETFGEDAYLPNGEINRKKVAQIIFNDESAKEKINEIVHPHVLQYQEQTLDRLKNSGKFKIAGAEAALIYEAGSESQFDFVIVVSAEKETVIKRLTGRDGFDKDEILKRIASQMDLSKKVKRADYVIHNDGTIQDLEKEVGKLLAWLQEKADQL
ncbi:dephospho-CoA kinase [candidate division KSB1 bacterium]|nr:dephospho-CoA kinase [candidate division KSB1 bacterium]MBL7093500.1 dephospho-CoA kinase [candidate division KSB1 bacterium]